MLSEEWLENLIRTHYLPYDIHKTHIAYVFENQGDFGLFIGPNDSTVELWHR